MAEVESFTAAPLGFVSPQLLEKYQSIRTTIAIVTSGTSHFAVGLSEMVVIS